MNKPGLKPGDDVSKRTPVPSEPPTQNLFAGGCSDFTDFEATDVDGNQSQPRIRLDDHIGVKDGRVAFLFVFKSTPFFRRKLALLT